MDPAAILAAVKCMAAEQGAAIERRRAADRERQTRRRAKSKADECHVTSRDVTGCHSDTPSPLAPPLSPAPQSPPIIPPTPADLLSGPALEAKLREAAGWQNEPAPGLFVTGSIEALIANGADLELDVLPVIRGRASKVRRPSSWAYFIGPIQDAMEARKSASTGPPLKVVSGAGRTEPKKSFEELAKELLPGWTPGPKFASSTG